VVVDRVNVTADNAELPCDAKLGSLSRLVSKLMLDFSPHLFEHSSNLQFDDGACELALEPVAAALISLYFTGKMSLTTAGAALFGFTMLKGQLRAVTGSTTDMYESLLFVGELDDFANEIEASRPVVKKPAPPTSRLGGVKMEEVAFTYPTARRPAVRGINLRVDPGEVIALVGPNGSGKTTVAKLLAGLYEPERGCILWNGIDRSTLDTKTLSERVAIGFQDFERFRLSASDNIAFGRQDLGCGQNVVAAAERAGALSFVSALPNGFDTPLGLELEGGGELSQGQWQRLALARVFFRDAELVILDEPTAALDALAEFELFETIRRGLAGRCAVVISHRLATVRTADRIYVLERGRIIEVGSHRELLGRAGLYARMYELQASAYTLEADPAPLSKAPFRSRTA
jgi:ATP-binding cassette, subfamily B, bacterial